MGISMEAPNDKLEAQDYFKKKYPEIVYDSTSDSYNYRGYKFDYFKSGHGFTFNIYLLVDKENPEIWLYSYGNLEHRWNDYLELKNIQKESFMSKMYNAIKNLLSI